jgi:hypothetical protein
METNQDYINKMYDSNLESQKAAMEQEYAKNQSNLDARQEAAQKQTDANLTRTYVEAAKAQKNYDEVQNAYGLTSGAMAQARLAQDNQLQADLTALRAQQQNVDAGLEREKALLQQQYAAAIRQAQAENDMAKAQALYDAAKQDEADLLQKQKAAAALMAGAGDYSLYAQLYGLTPEQLARLQGEPAAGSAGGGGGPVPGVVTENGNPTGTLKHDENKALAATGEAIQKGEASHGITNATSGGRVLVGDTYYTYPQLLQAVENGTVVETVRHNQHTFVPTAKKGTGAAGYPSDGGSVGDHYIYGLY